VIILEFCIPRSRSKKVVCVDGSSMVHLSEPQLFRQALKAGFPCLLFIMCRRNPYTKCNVDVSVKIEKVFFEFWIEFL